MKQFFLFLLALFVFIGCTSRTKLPKPKNLINQEKMIEIWTDLYLGRSAKTLKTKNLRVYKDYLPLIFEKHQIDSLQFADSNLYYTANIDVYLEMFLRIEENLKNLNREYNPDPTLDSILNMEDALNR